METLRFKAVPEASAHARHCMCVLKPSIPKEIFDDVQLLTSELVTNSVRHAGFDSDGWVDLAFSNSNGTVYVQVSDDGPGPRPHSPCIPPNFQESGRGLVLVDKVADRWGVRLGARAATWFEIDLPHSGAPRSARLP